MRYTETRPEHGPHLQKLTQRNAFNNDHVPIVFGRWNRNHMTTTHGYEEMDTKTLHASRLKY